MPTVVAILVATAAGWTVEAPVRALLGPGVSLATSLVVSTAAYFVTKRYVSDLRGGS